MYNTGARVSEVIGLRVGDVVIDGTNGCAPPRQGPQGAKRAALAINRVADPGLEAPAGGRRR